MFYAANALLSSMDRSHFRPDLEHSAISPPRIFKMRNSSALNLLLCTLCLLFLLCASQPPLVLYHLDPSQDAFCNDGSLAGYYVRTSQTSDKWVIYLMGGFWYELSELLARFSVSLTLLLSFHLTSP